ncbi:MAG: sulfotransferase [Cyanothece sp. SIO1E1]|nr:sulfotransferase [Cyanothece sp. SIO1E1]
MKLPNFLIIGVEKSGTTSIYNYLKQHPQIYMSPVKETNFLEKNWEEIDAEIRAKINLERVRSGRKERIDTFDKYCQLFEAATDEIALGEVSPNYLFHYQSSSERILKYVPHAKLIAMLRNPVERAYSDYLMHVRDVIGTTRSLSEQLQYRSNSSFTLRKGLYSEPLEYFFAKFNRDQIKIYLYEDFCQDPIGIMQDMYRFIGVDDAFCPDMTKRSQVAQVPKVESLNALLKTKNPLRSTAAAILKFILPLEVRQNLRSSLINMNSQGKEKAQLAAEERQQLIEFYRGDILKLQDLLGRDLSAWLDA